MYQCLTRVDSADMTSYAYVKVKEMSQNHYLFRCNKTLTLSWSKVGYGTPDLNVG